MTKNIVTSKQCKEQMRKGKTATIQCVVRAVVLKLHAESQDLSLAEVAALLEVDLIIGATAVSVALPALHIWRPARILHLLLNMQTLVRENELIGGGMLQARALR